MSPDPLSCRRERIDRFRRSRLYPVISSEFCAGRPVEMVFAAAIDGGAGVIQLREKHRDRAELLELAKICRRLADRTGALLIIDDHADVAHLSGADGVHVGQDDQAVSEIRAAYPELLIGKSTHDLSELLAAQAEADYINIGPVYPTSTKSVGYPALGLAKLQELIPQVNIPFSVMGGIKERHLAELTALGAKHIAMVTEITQAPDVEAQVRRLQELIIGSERQ